MIPFNLNTMVIESNTMRKQKNCENRKQGIFSDTHKDNMIIDCFNYEINRTYSCLPVYKRRAYIRWERDLKYFKYNICPMNMSTDIHLHLGCI